MNMVDLHHHLLPGLDDGSPDLETSMEMARIAVDDGITHIVATPHANNMYEFRPEAIAAALQELNAAIAREHLPLTLATGCDFHLSYDNIQDAIENPQKYTIGGGDYLLVELPDHGLSPHLNEAFYELGLAGLKLILTHPERNPTLQRDPARLADWLRIGVLMQVTTSSVLGHMGRSAQRMAQQLLDDRWVHFLATDAHNTGSRPPRMRAAYDAVAKKYGTPYAHMICETNPLAVFENKIMPEQLEPRGLYEEDVEAKPWWKTLWKW
jgi:protein-tyrosine phosphatase